MRLLKSLTRLLAQVRKELIQVRRRPAAFFSLVLGPFLVMAVFGVGYTGTRQPLATAIVVPGGVDLPTDAAFYEQVSGPGLKVVSVTNDLEWARSELVADRLDVVVAVPADATERLRGGERAQLDAFINEVDPVSAAYAGFLADIISAHLNREILTRLVQEGESYVINRTDSEPLGIPAEVIAAPTELVLTNLAPSQPVVVTYFGPAVLALVLQHMAVTLTALSFVRERASGVMELFRVSPVNSLELVLGKYLGLGIVSAIVATITTLLLIYVLGVPLLGDPWLVVAIVALLSFASLGVGLLISVVSDSERQAVQLSLLVLLASVFFSGFVLPVHEFTPLVQGFSYLLPVTHGIALLQDVMLRGGTQEWWQLSALGASGVVLFLLTALLLRRTVSAR
ncbi:MAG TPA: ABC transporter permease [Candidatus Limnocylindrales bacterium]